MGAVMPRAAAALALFLLAPLFAVLSLAIWWEDRGRVLFWQTRVGQDGKPFHLPKLRSMRRNEGGPLITRSGDSRITRVGMFIRRYKLDELPQLWSVMSGKMAFVGPRPEVPRYVDAADPLWREVLRYRPGITDLATLIFRDEEQLLAEARDVDATYRTRILPAKLALNLEYARSRSLWTDLKLIALSVRYSFVPAGFDAGRVAGVVMGKAHRIDASRV